MVPGDSRRYEINDCRAFPSTHRRLDTSQPFISQRRRVGYSSTPSHHRIFLPDFADRRAPGRAVQGGQCYNPLVCFFFLQSPWFGKPVLPFDSNLQGCHSPLSYITVNPTLVLNRPLAPYCLLARVPMDLSHRLDDSPLSSLATSKGGRPAAPTFKGATRTSKGAARTSKGADNLLLDPVARTTLYASACRTWSRFFLVFHMLLSQGCVDNPEAFGLPVY
jgi:hypothetical protein